MAVAIDTTAPTFIELSINSADVIGGKKANRVLLAGGTADAALTTIAADLDALSNAHLIVKVAKDSVATGLKGAAVNAVEPQVKTLVGLNFIIAAPERKTGVVEKMVTIPAPIGATFTRPGGNVDTTNATLNALAAALAAALVYERFNSDGTIDYVSGFIFDAAGSGLLNENGVRAI